MGNLQLVKTGIGTCIQDTGRFGYTAYGVPVSGALDMRSYLWVNHLLQNKETDAALEISQPGLSLHFDSPTLICLAGANAAVQLNGKATSSYCVLEIRKNDQLQIGAIHQGAILYLGIKNGFQSEKIMNSRSWYPGITASSYLKKDDRISYFPHEEESVYTASKIRLDFNWMEEPVIEAYPGPEWGLLDKQNKSLIETGKFTVSSLKNRMAIQLMELLPNSIPELATAPVFPGTVQLTSGGKLLVLLKDAQVTGGYPRILQLDEKSIALISQKRPKDQLVFKLKKL
ncbi:5-oxoprolinase subunit C family protein [Algoriphagus resistens]|uniref:5-oxoprolinase subunit C family protein n=1 Tax=Algoriphagus resistens TaxID=1750590 RepID=UPI000AEA78CB|nr:biotin-dependent carboxyltransferase family protein [Algoriphagus resistens]